jgi:hypothetical protein
MSSQEARPRAPYMNVQQLREFVRRACERGFFKEGFHSEYERAYRNISPDDIVYGLERKDWVLCEDPDYDGEFKSWEYLIQTWDIEGEELHLKIAVNAEFHRFEVITKW